MIKVTYAYPWMRPAAIDRRAVLKELADNGIKRLVLTCNLIEDMIRTPELVISCGKDLENYGLEFCDAHAPFGLWKDLAMPLEKFHDIVIMRHKMAIRLCAEFGVTSLTFHTGNTTRTAFGDVKLDDYYEVLLRSLNELLPDAEKYGVVLALENQWTPLNQTPYLLKAIKHFDSPFLGLCYDSGHARLTQFGQCDPAKSVVPYLWNEMGLPVYWENDIISQFQPYLINCHIHDNNGFNDEHLLPGAGTIDDWEHIFEVCSKAPRLQCVQSEVSINENVTVPELRSAFKNLSPLLDA